MVPHGETDLSRLLATLSPTLQEGEFYFASLRTDLEPRDTDSVSGALADAARAAAIGTFREAEGLSLILPAAHTELPDGTARSTTQRLISLEVHSSLEAIGLTAIVSQRLAELSISCNVVAAFHHDHIFVSADKADAAVDALRGIQADAAAAGR